MDIATIKAALGATVLEGDDKLSTEIVHVYASDLMSDVLAFGRPSSVLLTGLASEQSVIAAHMAEFECVVLLRGKKFKDGAQQAARNNNLVLMSSALDMYDACLRLEASRRGKMPAFGAATKKERREEILLTQEMTIEGSDFANAGMISTEVKSLLKKIGLNPELVRRVAISLYEAEMNVHLHATRAKVTFSVTPHMVELVLDDEGKGIEDVSMAMQEGWTTATEEMRKMGFGSGMGLPNIKKNADFLDVKSYVGKGTKLTMRFHV